MNYFSFPSSIVSLLFKEFLLATFLFKASLLTMNLLSFPL